MRSVRSALAQTHPSFEVVVVDDASTDGTLDRVEEVDDERVRVYRNARNLGQSRNWNQTLGLARGRLIKFLCADDVLYQDCLETMADLFDRHPALGLVFSQRDVEGERPDDPLTIEWIAKHGRAHTLFGDLSEANNGPALARRWLETGLARNGVGEPTNVMVSRDCLRRIGTFNPRLRQRVDMDLWLRAMLFFDVGFVDRPLARYLVRAGSVTSVNSARGLAWMDGLWLLEGLMSYPDAPRTLPKLRALRRRAAWSRARHALHRALLGDLGNLGQLREYIALRLRRADRPRLYGSLEDAISPSETIR
jgi:glycosyltransferase involved in cell wall biosynthesis